MNLREKADKLIDFIPVLIIALSKKETPIIAKMLAALAIGYALSPIDLIPDFIPFIGLLDDLIIVPVLIYLTVMMIPDEILEECKTQAKESNLRANKKWLYAIPVILIWAVLILVIMTMLMN